MPIHASLAAVLRQASRQRLPGSAGKLILADMLKFHLAPTCHPSSSLATPSIVPVCTRSGGIYPVASSGGIRLGAGPSGQPWSGRWAAHRCYSSSAEEPQQQDQVSTTIIQEQQKQQHKQQQKLNKGRRKPLEKMKQRLKEMQERQEKPAAITYAVASAQYLGKPHSNYLHPILS